MFIAHFTEQPWQDPEWDPSKGVDATGLSVSNRLYKPEIGARLYNRYIDEKLYAEEVGFDGLMLNEHHSMPGCMQGITNVEAAILARQTKRVKIAIMGNLLPLWDDPLWLAEQLAMIDMISHGRLVSGWVRGVGRESITHNSNPTINWERFQEAHEFMIKCWTVPGPWRWEGKYLQYRYVNPWCMPLQKPHPPIWLPGIGSVASAVWAAQHHIPYMSFASQMEQTQRVFDVYRNTAREAGYEAQPHNLGYLWKVHVEESEEKAYEVGKRYLEGVNNPFIAGNEGRVSPATLALPGLNPPAPRGVGIPGGQFVPPSQRQGVGPAGVSAMRLPYDEQLKNYTIVTGNPKSVIQKVRHVLEFLRPGTVFFWDGDGSMTHEDQMRSLQLMGQEVLPAVKDISKELGLAGPFESNDGAGYDQAAWARTHAPAS